MLARIPKFFIVFCSEQDLQEEMQHLQDKTNHFLRLRELLLSHSTDASLIVM